MFRLLFCAAFLICSISQGEETKKVRVLVSAFASRSSPKQRTVPERVYFKRLKASDSCSVCNGFGKIVTFKQRPKSKCVPCRGKGTIRKFIVKDKKTTIIKIITCKDCKGAKVRIEVWRGLPRDCPICKGTGKESDIKTSKPAKKKSKIIFNGKPAK